MSKMTWDEIRLGKMVGLTPNGTPIYKISKDEMALVHVNKLLAIKNYSTLPEAAKEEVIKSYEKLQDPESNLRVYLKKYMILPESRVMRVKYGYFKNNPHICSKLDDAYDPETKTIVVDICPDAFADEK